MSAKNLENTLDGENDNGKSSGTINVLESVEGIVVSDLAPEERIQLFHKLSKDNKLLPYDLFMSFKSRRDPITPTIPEALLRVIVNESTAFQANGADHLKPITNMLVIPVLSHQTVVGNNDTPPHAIRVSFDIPTRAVAPDGTPRCISAGTSVSISGIKLQGCDILAIRGYVRDADAIPAGRVRGFLPTSIAPTAGLGAHHRCSEMAPRIHPGESIGGLRIRLPYQFNFDDVPPDNVATILRDVLDWVRWVGESSYRQATIVYNKFSLNAKNTPAEEVRPYPLEKAQCPENIDIFNSLGYFEVGCAFHQTTRLQLRSMGLERAYDAHIISGRSASAPHIDAWKMTKTIEQWERNASNKVREDNVALKTYISIVDKAFGAQRRKKFADDVGKLRGKPIATILQKTLKPSELSVVNGEYKRRQEYLDAVVNNKCPHLRAAKILKRAVSDSEIASAYNQLKEYFAKSTSSDAYVECNKCHFGIICPHKRLLIELDLKRANTSAVRSAISPFTSSSGPGSPVFCKVCGETLSGLDALESYEAPRISHDDELAQFMWGEIAPIMRHFRFGPQIVVPQLITTVRDACYPYIFDIEKKLIRAKTASAAEILAKKKLYIDIYGFAYMILIVSKNPGGQIEFRGEIGNKSGGAAPRQKTRDAVNKAAGSRASLVELIKGVTGVIVVTRNVIIREIRGMTAETVRNTLIDAYKILSSQSGSMEITTSDMTEDLASDILLGCVYESFYRATVLNDLMSGKRAPKSEFDFVMRLPDILGGRLETLCKQGGKKNTDCSVFTNARPPRWNNIKPPSVNSLWTQTGGRHVPLFKAAINWNIAAGFDIFANRVINRLYTEPIWKPVVIDRLDDYTHVKYTSKVYDYVKSVREFDNIERVIERSRHLWSCQLYGSLGEGKRRKIPRVGLDRLYGDDGHLHKWEKTVIGDSVLSDADFVNAIMDSKPIQARDRTDLECSICGARKSKTGNAAKDDKILDALNKQLDNNNFYRFYESRCPAGGNHTPADKNNQTCSKCGLIPGKQSAEYYDEWRSTYLSEKAELNDIGVVAAPAAHVHETKKETITYSFDFSVIIRFAEIFNVPSKVIMSLGIPEIVDWSSVVSGTWTPPVITTRDHPRIFAVRGLIDGLVRGYNRLKLFKRIFKVPQSLILLIESAGVNRANMNAVAELLPEIPLIEADFPAVFNSLSPPEILEWLLEKFCDMCVWFTEQSVAEPAKTLMEKYVRGYVADVIRSAELTSKPGYFNWSLIYGDTVDTDETKSSAVAQEDADDEEDQSPFSMDHYDMEDGDADDDAHSNHAGDELGM